MKAHIENVLRKTKVVDQVGKIHIPSVFLDKLGIRAGDEVELALFTMYGEIRIKKGDMVET